ncbi:predicted protein [Botrytis cinerea T4]|uniref:Uncharacterized protein n=1 Tax=Botryotinia fuckeliana (strain T4) TaxID=999810 RepID=G2YVF7_BOTF4|nr:predicted protein [Botrytis cinerea T4]
MCCIAEIGIRQMISWQPPSHTDSYMISLLLVYLPTGVGVTKDHQDIEYSNKQLKV